MSRSSKKGPYIDEKLLQKILKQKQDGKNSQSKHGHGQVKLHLTLSGIH